MYSKNVLLSRGIMGFLSIVCFTLLITFHVNAEEEYTYPPAGIPTEFHVNGVIGNSNATGKKQSGPPAPNTSHHVTHTQTNKYVVTLNKLNWHAAYAYCELTGGSLVKIETAEEQFELENFLNYFNLQNETFWTSGHKLEDLHNFRWDYNGKQFSYTNWDVDQPDNYMHREHCVRLTEKFSKWDDYACEKPLHFICQKYGEDTTP